MPSKSQDVTQSTIFVHSLFRSGSTYFYNAIKRAAICHVYHEPMHEITSALPQTWHELENRREELKATLRHGFLSGGYFDEYAHLLPTIKKVFNPKLSFDLFFMDEKNQCLDLKNYVDALIDGAPKMPVFQCTRTIGRVKWLKANYQSKHVFLLRNPWDQWYSYKVDEYIATTPRIIYSVKNLPKVLREVMASRDLYPLPGKNTQEKLSYGYHHPIPPDADYCLFFGLWVYAFINGKQVCDVFVDMDSISASEQYRDNILRELSAIGLESLDLSDAHLHRTYFGKREQTFYRIIEDQVLEIFRQHGFDGEILNSLREYLASQRKTIFEIVPSGVSDEKSFLEDAVRMRGALLSMGGRTTTQIASLNQAVTERDGEIASLNQAVTERDGEIASLNQAVTERDGEIASLNQAVTERDGEIASLNQAVTERDVTIQAIKLSNSWKITAPFRMVSAIFRSKPLGDAAKPTAQFTTPGADAFFTICSKNFLAHARVLYNSVRPLYPESRFFVILCDRVDGLFDPNREPFEFVYLEDLQIPNLHEMSTRYNITEFNTAVKPFAFLYLMQKLNLGSVIYLDPDLYFVSKMDELDSMLRDGAEAVLTPHILQPAEQDEIHDGKMLLFGIYNLGFLALRNTAATQAFLSWWGRRLERDCVIRLEEGLFVDQKWADLLPAFVQGTRVLHHPGYNVAYWNLPQRKIVRRGDVWMANGEPLRFVHFSGNKLDDHCVFSRHSQQVTIENIGDLRELLNAYREKVYQEGHMFYRTLPYAYAWDGEAGVNLHTPKELDLASKDIKPIALDLESQRLSAGHSPRILDNIRRRIALLRKAVPLAQRLSGGWIPFAKRAWNVYRRHGWLYVKTKAVELSNYGIPPTMLASAPDEQPQKEQAARLLYLDWATPKPDQDAASVTAKLLMEIFVSLGYKVTFIPCGLKYESGYHEELVAANIEVIVYPEIHSVKDWLAENAARFDICIMARGPVVWPYLETLATSAPHLRLIFNTVDLHYLRELRQAELSNDEAARQAAIKVRAQELELIERCDLSILLSNEELYTIRDINPEARLAVLPVVFRDIPGSQTPFAARRDILFIGSFPHQPNIDAVLYFAQAVLPLIRARIPEICFKVIGANPPESIQRLAEEPGIEILGFVKDLGPVFSNIRLSVAPLRYGAGIKGKIGTSLCYGVPCVATPIAVEGMGLSAGKNILVGESLEELAEAVCNAYLNEKKWGELSAEGHRFAAENYSVAVIRERVGNLLSFVHEGWPPLGSSFEIESWDDFIKHSSRLDAEYARRIEREQALLPTDGAEAFSTTGYCAVCHQETQFLTSFMYSTKNAPNGRPMPNWREHMQCSHCGLVNRMRAALHVLHTHSKPKADCRIYLTERVTQTYRWLEERYPALQGSEYLGPKLASGTIVDGIRHEDVMNLSYDDGAFDRVLSFDVLEHVPDPDRAFREVYRVLDQNGVFLFSVPFSATSKTDEIRAELRTDGTVVHHLPAEYHGNPVDPEGGALCFRYFGWDILERLRQIGFTKAVAIAYWSEKQGYLGQEQYIFLAIKGSQK